MILRRLYPAFIRQFLSCLLLLTATAYPSGLLEMGTTAPDFHLHSQSGSEVSMKSYKGQWVVLFFFADHSSEQLALMARNLQRDRAKYREYNAVVIGIGRTLPDSNKAWAEENGLTFPLLSDPDGLTAKAYGVPTINADNTDIYETIVAPSGKVQLPRITDFDFDGESRHLLACLQVFKDHPSPMDGR